MEVRLANGAYALVDATDATRIDAFRWTAYTMRDKQYVVALHTDPRVYLHRFLLEAPSGYEVDHINGDPLDNRRANLRLVTHAQNLQNQRPQMGRSSRYKGVSKCQRVRLRECWISQIKVAGTTVHLGHFRSETAAARAYDAAARHHWGAYARINFPDDVSPPAAAPVRPVDIGGMEL